MGIFHSGARGAPLNFTLGLIVSSEIDIFTFAYDSVRNQGGISDAELKEICTAKFPLVSQQQLDQAIEVARKLKFLVDQNPFYNDNSGGFPVKIREYLEKEAPGLPERTYFLAVHEAIKQYLY